MNEQTGVEIPIRTPKVTVPPHSVLQQERRFFLLASIVLLLITGFGFRQFLMHGKGADGIPLTPEIVLLVTMHGIALLLWVILLVVQSLLIVTGRRRLHITLGALGAVLATSIVILSAATAMLSTRYNPAIYAEFGGSRYFLAFALTATLMFGAFATAGIIYRSRPDVHRPMMLLATVAMMTGAFDRFPFIPWLMAISHGNVPVFHWGPTLVLGAVLLALHTAMTRRLSHWHAAGYASAVVAILISIVVAPSAAWNQLAALVIL